MCSWWRWGRAELHVYVPPLIKLGSSYVSGDGLFHDWLGILDSNQGYLIQSQASYR